MTLAGYPGGVRGAGAGGRAPGHVPALQGSRQEIHPLHPLGQTEGLLPGLGVHCMKTLWFRDICSDGLEWLRTRAAILCEVMLQANT